MRLTNVTLLTLRHVDGCLICYARGQWRRWGRVRDAAGTAMVLILALGAIYFFAALLNTLAPPTGVGQ